ncbi:collagen alpha-1(I) chain-like [Theropithecus gelada]|uniref:collagen alpha-1(I) chain-like n=1 Tax=Theropithecus gelada TaxID=9565 RepID=UPI000DC19881|nr:collagen alpha-1(I) chain-like [Theropithecus gelada]
MIAIPGGGGGGCWLRGASVTSPGEPRTASGQAGGLRAAGAGWGVGAGPRVSARGGRRGLAPEAGRALGLAGARARLRLGLRAAGSASLALQVRVTHTVTRARPSRSLAPPPRRRRAGQTHWRAWTEVAGNVHVGHPGREGAAGEGAGRDPESSADRRGCDFAAWGASLAPPPPQAGEPSQGHPHLRLTDVPGTQMSRGVRGQGAPSLLLPPVKPGTAAPSPRAEAVSAPRSDAPRPKDRKIRGEPGDPRPRGAEGCTAPAPTGLFREDASRACPREVLGSWMRKSLLSPAPRPRAF